MFVKSPSGDWIETKLLLEDVINKRSAYDKWVPLDLMKRKTFHKKEGSLWRDQIRY